MSRTTGLIVVFAVLLGLGARYFVPSSDETPAEEFRAPARQVEPAAAADPWTPASDVRDPFVPLVLPATPADSAADVETAEDPEDG